DRLLDHPRHRLRARREAAHGTLVGLPDLRRDLRVEGGIRGVIAGGASDAADRRIAEARADGTRLHHHDLHAEWLHREAERVAPRLPGVVGGMVEGAPR